MVTVLPGDYGSFNLGQTLAASLGQNFENISDTKALQKAMSEVPENASPQDILKSLLGTRTYNPQAKQEAIQNFLSSEQLSIARTSAAKRTPTAKEREELTRHYASTGATEEEASLLSSPLVPDSAKQEIFKILVDRKLREAPEGAVKEPNQLEVEEKWPVVPPKPGLTPKERESARRANVTANTKALQSIEPKLDKSRSVNAKLDKLNSLVPELPEGIGSLILNPATGEPYALAQLTGKVNESTQLFLKTVNEFLTDTKGSFGGNVTNFQVDTFKKSLPSLMNSKDGVRMIIEQMKVLEDINLLREQEMAEALRHYGGDLDYLDISKIVDQNMADQVENTTRKMEYINDAVEMQKRLTADKYKGYRIWYNPEKGLRAVPPGKETKARQEGLVPWNKAI